MILSPDVRSILLGTAGLWVAAAVSVVLTIHRGPITATAASLRAAVRVACLAIAVQIAHFAEEFATKFYERFPQQLGLTAWSPTFFVTFNVLWILMWVITVPGVLARRRVALFPLWFLGIASLANGVAHPLLAANSRAYFPGLITSPLALICGAILLQRLLFVTQRTDRC